MKDLLNPNVKIEEVEAGIYSALPPEQRTHEYDDKTGVYDSVIGHPLYNRIVWKNALSDYADFCREALDSRPNGPVLDAGCGTLVFTGAVYADYTARPLVLLDRSLGMLRQAKARLVDADGRLPENITLIQGDIFDLPFRAGVFETVASYGMLHIFSNTRGFMDALQQVKSAEGSLYFTSLVGNTWLGKQYLKMLHRAGEVAVMHSSASLTAALKELGRDVTAKTIGNMAYYSVSEFR